jgi:hypothetical protein
MCDAGDLWPGVHCGAGPLRGHPNLVCTVRMRSRVRERNTPLSRDVVVVMSSEKNKDKNVRNLYLFDL